MKKTAFLFTILICVSLLLAGCGKKSPPAPQQQASQTPPKASAPAQKPVIKKVVSQVEDKEEGTPFTEIKVRNWDASKEAQKVEEESDNVRVKDVQAVDAPKKLDANKQRSKSLAGKLMKTPSKSMAAQLTPADNSKVIEWQPKWRQKGIGGAWIPSVALSEDRSVLCVLETTGKDEGPYGSRLIVINTYDWSVLAVYEYEDKYYTSIEFAGTSSMLVALASRQAVMKQPCVFNGIDLRTGKLTEGQLLQTQPVCWKAFDDKRIFASFPDSEHLYELKIGELFISAPVKTSIDLQVDAIAVSPDRKNMALASKSLISFIAMRDMRVFHKSELRENQAALKLEYGGNSLLAAVLNDGTSIYIKNGALPEDFRIKEANTVLSYYAPNNTLIVGDNYMSTLYFFDCDRPSGEIKKSSVSGIKPHTSSFISFAAYLPGNDFILVVDKSGNIYRVWSEDRRYGKEILFSGMDSLIKK